MLVGHVRVLPHVNLNCCCDNTAWRHADLQQIDNQNARPPGGSRWQLTAQNVAQWLPEPPQPQHKAK